MKPLRGQQREKGHRQLGCLCLCAALAAPALADPMRPLLAPAASAGAASAAGTVAAPAMTPLSGTATTGERRLLAIRQDSSGERTALFGDRWLRAGDRYAAPQGETLVRAVGSNHIELEQDKVRTTHHLLAPLLPTQWPTLPATQQAARPAAPPAATAATAHRPERPPTP